MNLLKIYVKNNKYVQVSPKFRYCSSIYKIWKKGAYLITEKFYISTTPIKLKNIVNNYKKKNYQIHRFIELESAPEEYLINQGYKLVNE